MAIYHMEAKVVSRGAGRSAVAASAYLSCSRLYNDYDGIQHDYTKKRGLVWQEVFLPKCAPQEWQDREKTMERRGGSGDSQGQPFGAGICRCPAHGAEP